MNELNQTLKEKKGEDILGYSYTLGTFYARFFREIAADSGMSEKFSERKKLAQAILETLEDFAQKTKNYLDNAKQIPPELLIESFQSANKNLSLENCLLFKTFSKQRESLAKGCADAL